MTKPLPCPFCGHEADASRIGLTNRYGVTCTNDDCPVEAQATGGTLEEAVKLWNTRPTNVIPFPIIAAAPLTDNQLASVPGGLL